MGSLNPEWLSIELNSIDATAENWSSAIQASYKAAVESMHNKEVQKQSPSLESAEHEVKKRCG